MSDRSLAWLSAAQLSTLYARRELSPVDAVEAMLARAAQLQLHLNAFVLIDEAGARAAAKVSQERWQKGAPLSPLDGVPTSIKDTTQVKGWPTRYGSHATDETAGDVRSVDLSPTCVMPIMAPRLRMSWRCTVPLLEPTTSCDPSGEKTIDVILNFPPSARNRNIHHDGVMGMLTQSKVHSICLEIVKEIKQTLKLIHEISFRDFE